MKKSLFCKPCWQHLKMPIILRGPFSIPFRIFGLRPSRMNPNICTMCEKHFAKIIKLKKWGEKSITIPATILFTDVRGYTRLSETTTSSQIARLLSNFYENCAKVVWEHDGIINNMIGDAILVIFNWPINREDNVIQAVQAGIEMQKRWFAIKPEIDSIEGGKVSVTIGIGISMGNISIGELSQYCKDYTYTAFGPVVNLASRLQGAAKGGEVLVTEDIYNQINDVFPHLKGQTYNLKGIEKPVKAYALHI